VDDEDFAEDFAADQVETTGSDAPIGDLEADGTVSDLEALGATDWQLPEPTGVQAVDESLEPMLELGHLPTGEHVAYYEVAHRRLQDALADLDGS
jgi:hypothetical protein